MADAYGAVVVGVPEGVMEEGLGESLSSPTPASASRPSRLAAEADARAAESRRSCAGRWRTEKAVNWVPGWEGMRVLGGGKLRRAKRKKGGGRVSDATREIRTGASRSSLASEDLGRKKSEAYGR